MENENWAGCAVKRLRWRSEPKDLIRPQGDGEDVLFRGELLLTQEVTPQPSGSSHISERYLNPALELGHIDKGHDEAVPFMGGPHHCEDLRGYL
jgi:hypothetical protein